MEDAASPQGKFEVVISIEPKSVAVVLIFKFIDLEKPSR